MAAFRFAELDPVLLEKIITKVESNSYFRLQQTCHGVKEIIRRSPNIRIHLDGIYNFRFNKDTTSWRLSSVDIDVFQGIRIKTVSVDEDADGFEQLCESLKKCRITCTSLSLNMFNVVWNLEQLGILLNILKPVNVTDNSKRSDRLEALLQLTTLKKVNVALEPAEVVLAVPKLLSAIPNVSISVTSDFLDAFPSLRDVLQILRSKPFPHLNKFRANIQRETRRLPTKAELEQEFREFKMAVKEQKSEDEMSALVVLPQQFPHGFACEVTVEDDGFIDVVYRSTRVRPSNSKILEI